MSQNTKDKKFRDAAKVTAVKTAAQPGLKAVVEDGCCGTDSGSANSSGEQGGLDHNQVVAYILTLVSLVLLVSGIALDYFGADWFTEQVQLPWFGVAYLLVGGKVLFQAAKNITRGDVFNEFFLMGIATLGAFFIGEYAEGVAVMLFYVIGEHFQEFAVKRSRRSIKELIDNRPDIVNVFRNGHFLQANPGEVAIGETIQVKAGEKVALDGDLLTNSASFNTAALTGESKPDTRHKGERILAGMVNLDNVVELKVTSAFEDSALSKILLLVEQASSRKAKTQKFITSFAKIYTPIVVFLAIGLVLIPYFIIADYVFRDWLYRALVFLVISCPCALVISISLGYFGGIGAASKNGILFKGSNFLDSITKVDTVVMDKTGTLTRGVFEVQQVVVAKDAGIESKQFLEFLAALESQSNHPIAKAITAYAGEDFKKNTVSGVVEIPGHGLSGKVAGREVLAGNAQLLRKFEISFDDRLENIAETTVLVAIEGKYAGHVVIADEIKEDAVQAVKELYKLGIKEIIMLSGDKTSVVEAVASKLSIDKAFGGLLPQEKVEKVEALKNQGKRVAFVGDGINDAPVITLADVGIAMGGLGSDAAIETADVVIQNDQPTKIGTAIKIGKKTKQVVWQNIGLSFGVKAIVLALGAAGAASLWEAVFADVGVALLAILNAVRIQKIKF